MGIEQNRIEAQSFLDKMKVITDNFNGGNSITASSGKQNHIGKDGKLLGYWENSSKFLYTNGDDEKLAEYSKYVKDLGFTWIGSAYKALTPAEYDRQKGNMFGGARPQTKIDIITSFFTPVKIIIGLVITGIILKCRKVI